ncbi:hypothetical protein JOF53_007359 [Crossiella equi]|uniref:Uncharacterized protein n=1 Tax=Crossiella equi TaxID=130796 RepID=A0ABS5AQG3_9PSEU|nr:hypothetical protein [Crossiella equi]MBP2478487.1 hypothetical protein [Crossiella equi]
MGLRSGRGLDLAQVFACHLTDVVTHRVDVPEFGTGEVACSTVAGSASGSKWTSRQVGAEREEPKRLIFFMISRASHDRVDQASAAPGTAIRVFH